MSEHLERFTAWAVCPGCGLVDCHRFRMPTPAPEPLPAVDIGDPMLKGLRILQDAMAVIASLGVDGPVDESAFEVIRICRCGREWGVRP